MEAVSLPVSVVAVGVAAIAAWFDLRTGRIPNLLCAAGGVLGIALGVAFGGWHGLLMSVSGGLVAALVPLLLFRLGAMGGGDVKLLFALGSLLGVQAGLEAESMAFVVGAIQGLVVWARQGRLRSGLKAAGSLVVPFSRARRRRSLEVGEAAATTIRFGPAILAGTLAAVSMAVAV